MIEMVDGEIGKVIKALQAAGLEENSIIVFTADHGDCAGAHGWNQKTVFYEESVRVPLIISWKGKTPAGTSDKLVNVGIDLLPTIFQFTGIAKPEELPGVSLMDLSLGKKVGKWREYVISENDLQQSGEIDGFKPTMEGRMVRTDKYKYCIYSKGNQRESLVDMENDPGETINLATDPAYNSVLLKHRQLLKTFGIENKDPLVGKLLENNVQPIPFVTP
jgi:arylsulfatase A-like enzyme